MESNTDEEVILNTQEETTNSNQVETDESSEESVEEYKARLAKAEELANNYKIRAEKAEKKAKEPEQRHSSTKEGELSTMDIIALSKSNIDSEDMGEVVKWAKYNNISINEALKSQELNAVLGVRKEMRTTATATNTGGAKRSSGKISDETLLSRASSGNLPESEEELDRLVRLKMQPKR